MSKTEEAQWDTLYEIREALERHEAASMHPANRTQAEIDAECVQDVQKAMNWYVDPSLRKGT